MGQTQVIAPGDIMIKTGDVQVMLDTYKDTDSKNT